MGVSRSVCAIKTTDMHEPILIDSGSAEHVCPKDWHGSLGMEESSIVKGSTLGDVQGNRIEDFGTRTVKFNMQSVEGSATMRGGARACRISREG